MKKIFTFAVAALMTLGLAAQSVSESTLQVGGLTVSTFVTLIVVPVLYGVFNRRGDIEKKERERRKFVFMNIDLHEKST